MKRININDRLPNEKQTVLVYSSIDGIGLGYLNNRITGLWFWRYKRVNGSGVISHVTHWAEVEPPEMGND